MNREQLLLSQRRDRLLRQASGQRLRLGYQLQAVTASWQGIERCLRAWGKIGRGVVSIALPLAVPLLIVTGGKRPRLRRRAASALWWLAGLLWRQRRHR